MGRQPGVIVIMLGRVRDRKQRITPRHHALGHAAENCRGLLRIAERCRDMPSAAESCRELSKGAGRGMPWRDQARRDRAWRDRLSRQCHTNTPTRQKPLGEECCGVIRRGVIGRGVIAYHANVTRTRQHAKNLKISRFSIFVYFYLF